MNAISPTTLSNAFAGMKIMNFDQQIYWIFILRIELTTSNNVCVCYWQTLSNVTEKTAPACIQSETVPLIMASVAAVIGKSKPKAMLSITNNTQPMYRPPFLGRPSSAYRW